MNWRDIEWNIVTLGRVTGIGIILAGVVLAALDASALHMNIGNSSTSIYSHYKVRYFLHDVVGFAWKGGLVFAAAEVADRFGWGGNDWMDWHGTRVLRWLGLAVIVVGIGATIWDLSLLPDPNSSAVIRDLMHSVIGSLWGGGVLLLAAALADRIGWPETETEEHAEAPV